MVLTAKLLFVVAALVCAVIALLVAVAVVSGNFDAWLSGALIAYFASLIAP